MIPKLIHQTWKTKEIPYNIYNPVWISSWILHHPEWKYRLWTDEDLQNLTEEYFPEHLEFFIKAPGVVKSDYGRYLLLHLYGGLYADLDYECYKPIEPLLNGQNIIFSYTNQFETTINNALLACDSSDSAKKFYKNALHTCFNNWTSTIRVETATGPDMLTKLWLQHNKPGKVYGSKILCPINWTCPDHLAIAQGSITKENLSILKKKYIDEGAYAATYWTHNW